MPDRITVICCIITVVLLSAGFVHDRKPAGYPCSGQRSSSTNQSWVAYRSENGHWCVWHPQDVYLIDDAQRRVAFSTLRPEDSLVATDAGLGNTITFYLERGDTASDQEPLNVESIVIDGEPVEHTTRVGAFGGEIHESFAFKNRDLLVTYVRSAELTELFREMVDSVRFD